MEDIQVIKNKCTNTITNDNFSTIMDDYYEEIFYYVYKQTSDQEETKDLTQEIFIKLYRSRNYYRPNKASIRTFLYRIAQNHCIDYHKSAYKKLKYQTQPLIQEVEHGEDLLENLISQERATYIVTLMKKILNEKHFKIMNLYIFSELSIQEISDACSLPIKTVYNAISVSIKKIKFEIEVKKK